MRFTCTQIMNAHNLVHIKHTHTNFYTDYEYTYIHTHRGIHKTLYTDYENTKKYTHSNSNIDYEYTYTLAHRYTHKNWYTDYENTKTHTHTQNIHLQIPTQTKNIHTHIVYTQNLTPMHLCAYNSGLFGKMPGQHSIVVNQRIGLWHPPHTHLDIGFRCTILVGAQCPATITGMVTMWIVWSVLATKLPELM